MVDLFFFRGVERIIIVLAATFFAYLGYKLYIHGITATRSQIDFKSKFMKFAVSGTGPGLVFMVFGAVVLVFSLVLGGVSTTSQSVTSEETVKRQGGAQAPELTAAQRAAERSLPKSAEPLPSDLATRPDVAPADKDTTAASTGPSRSSEEVTTVIRREVKETKAEAKAASKG